MKTFLLNIPNEIRNWNNSLDAKSLLCSQSWNVFNDEGIKEVYIFQNDGTLIASHNGKVTKAKWEYIPQNTSLIIENLGADIYMLNPVCYDDKVLTLQVDGTNNFALLISNKFVQQLMLDSVAKVNSYIEEHRQLVHYENVSSAHTDWEIFIQKKANEHFHSHKIQEKIAEQKKKKKKRMLIYYLSILLSSILSCINSYFFFLVAIILLSLFVIPVPDEYDYFGAIREMKAKYPFESFNQQTSHNS